MAKQTSKEQLLKDIHAERRRLEKTLSKLLEDEMIQPGVTGNWSVKDILAHLTAWQNLFRDWYKSGGQDATRLFTPVGMSRKKMDALNRQIHEKNRLRGLQDVLAEFHGSHLETVTVIEAIPEVDMFARGRFEWTGSLTLADYIAGNTCSHDAWAGSQIRKWAKRIKS